MNIRNQRETSGRVGNDRGEECLMGFIYYDTIFLIPSGHSLSFPALAEMFRNRFADDRTLVKVEEGQANVLVLRSNGWTLRVAWDDASYVLEESVDMAQFAVGEEEKAAMASCARRITTGGDDDPGAIYFNVYVMALEVLDAIPGLYNFDPYTMQVRKTG
jgi:hypothetical protein